MQQLLFNEMPKLQYNFHSFYTFDSKMFAIIEILKGLFLQTDHNAIYLYGGKNYGKTHLLQSAALYGKDDAIFLDLNDEALHHEMLYELNYSLICLDNLDKIIGNRKWEEAIFNLYNNSIFDKCFLLISSLTAPNQLDFILPDLKSRLNQSLILPISKMDDQQKIAAINHLMKNNNIKVQASVVEYIFKHFSRDLKVVVDYLIHFSNLALKEQKKLNIKFIYSKNQGNICNL